MLFLVWEAAMAEWKTLFSGEKNGRMITLEQYYEGNSLRLKATSIGNLANDVPGNAGLVRTTKAGPEATLEIHAADATQLARRLIEEGGFAEDVAKEIAQLGHAASAAVPRPEQS
jgi:hypothetical protein